jgi:RNA polymerase sigma-70 factor (ECF subfamily)
MRQYDRVEEQRLISRAKEGDMDAFESLVKTHQQAIYRLCRRMTGRHQLADDVAQETFIKAYFALPGFRDGLNFFSWIRKIAVNTTLNHLKSGKREEPLRESDSAITALPQDELQEHEIRHKVEKAVEALPSEQKAVFVLRIQESLSYREIAAALRISEGTVMSRLHRARHKLKEALAGDLGWRRA